MTSPADMKTAELTGLLAEDRRPGPRHPPPTPRCRRSRPGLLRFRRGLDDALASRGA